MPTVPAVTSRSIMPQPAVRAYQSGRVTAEDFGAGGARALLRAGAQTEAAAIDFRRQEYFEGTAEAARAEAEIRAKWSEELQRRTQEAPEDVRGFRQQFETDFDQDIGAATANLSPIARARLQASLPTIRSGLANQAGTFEYQGRRAKATADAERAWELEGNALMRDENGLEGAQARTRDMIAASPDMSPGDKARTARRAEQNLTLRTYQGLLNRDPEKAKTWLEEGRHDAILDPGAKATLTDAATREIERRKAIAEQEQYGSALLMATDDPASARKALAGGQFPALKDGHRAAVESRIKASERALRSEALGNLRVDATDHAANLTLGAPSPGADQTIIALRRLGDEKTADRLEALSEAQGGLAAFQSQGFVEQQAEMGRLRAELDAGRGTPEVRTKLDMFGRALTAKAEGFRTDALATAERMGMVELPPINFQAGPQAWAGTFQQRAEIARNISVQQGVPVPALTDGEASALANAYERADTNGRVAILDSMVRGFGRQAPETLALLFKKGDKSGPVLALSGAIAGSGADGAQVARDIVRGHGVLSAEGRDYMPTEMLKFGEHLQTRIGDAFGGAHAKTRAAITEAIEAHYAGQAATAGDRSKSLDKTRLDKAIAAVTGGILEWNGEKIPSPARGITQRRFDDQMRLLTDDDLADARYRDPTVKVTADDIRRFGKLHALSDGTYAVSMAGIALETPLKEKFILDLRPVMARPRPAP